MRARLHQDVARVEDVRTGAIYAMRLPAGQLIALEGVSAIIFEDLVAGRDAVDEAVARWPEGGDEVVLSTEAFLQQLESAGIVEFVAAARARRAAPVDETPFSPADEPTVSQPAVFSQQRDPGAPYRILFVCTANICRSAFADVFTSTNGVPGVEFASAGTHALVGHEMDPPMVAALPAGMDASGHRARQLTRTSASEADLIVAMSERHRSYILEEWPAMAQKTFLIGHVARELQTLPAEATWDDIAPHLWHNRTQMPEDNVRDPYGRGDQVALDCGAKITSFLDVILGQLSAHAPGGNHVR